MQRLQHDLLLFLGIRAIVIHDYIILMIIPTSTDPPHARPPHPPSPWTPHGYRGPRDPHFSPHQPPARNYPPHRFPGGGEQPRFAAEFRGHERAGGVGMAQGCVPEANVVPADKILEAPGRASRPSHVRVLYVLLSTTQGHRCKP